MADNTCKLCHRDKWNTDSENGKFDDEFCIFHSFKVEEKEEEFNKEFEKGYPDKFVNTTNQSFFNGKYLNFESFVFPKFKFFRRKKVQIGISFSKAVFRGKVCFTECTFHQSINFSKTHFYNKSFFCAVKFLSYSNFCESIFHKECKVDFQSSEFNKSTNFWGTRLFNTNFHMAKFNTDAVFIDSKFFGSTDFTGAQFYEKAIFGATIFKKRVSFRHCFFNKEVVFNSAIFEESAIFTESTINGFFDFSNKESNELDFNNCSFLGKATFLNRKIKSGNFQWCEFKDSVWFNNLIVEDKGYLDFRNCKFHETVDLRIESCPELSLSQSVNYKLINLKPNEERSIITKTLDLYNMHNSGTISIDWFEQNLNNLIDNSSVKYKQKANQYRMLKENYRKQGHYNQEDEAYYEFKKNDIRIEKQEYKPEYKRKNFLGKIKSFPKFACINIKFAWFWLAYEKIGGYGTKPHWIGITMGVIVMLFSAGYYFFCPKQTYLESLYHSIITFLTIGYGEGAYENIYESVGLTIWSGFEGFLGLFLMSYFTVAFVRKVLR